MSLSLYVAFGRRLPISVLLLSLLGATNFNTSSFAAGKGLPPVVMDSFVRQASGRAELIYGDESHQGPPPYQLFTADHRINSGIYDVRDAGLTTGHGSRMPDAWGKDEFLGQEWSISGPNGASSLDPIGKTYVTPGSGVNADQAPGGTQELNWLTNVDENTLRRNETTGQIEPLPVSWNRQLASSGDPTRWEQGNDGSWRNSTTGETVSPDGTMTYGKLHETRSGTFYDKKGPLPLQPQY